MQKYFLNEIVTNVFQSLEKGRVIWMIWKFFWIINERIKDSIKQQSWILLSFTGKKVVFMIKIPQSWKEILLVDGNYSTGITYDHSDKKIKHLCNKCWVVVQKYEKYLITQYYFYLLKKWMKLYVKNNWFPIMKLHHNLQHLLIVF